MKLCIGPVCRSEQDIGLFKPYSSFNKIYGKYTKRCKSCTVWVQFKKKIIAMSEYEKICTMCDTAKNVSEYNNSKYGYETMCKDCKKSKKILTEMASFYSKNLLMD